MNEIFGHVIIKLKEYLFNESVISPDIKNMKYSANSWKRGRELGQILNVEIFGKLLDIMTINEICFIFNINNSNEND